VKLVYITAVLLYLLCMTVSLTIFVVVFQTICSSTSWSWWI